MGTHAGPGRQPREKDGRFGVKAVADSVQPGEPLRLRDESGTDSSAIDEYRPDSWTPAHVRSHGYAPRSHADVRCRWCGDEESAAAHAAADPLAGLGDQK